MASHQGHTIRLGKPQTCYCGGRTVAGCPQTRRGAVASARNNTRILAGMERRRSSLCRDHVAPFPIILGRAPLEPATCALLRPSPPWHSKGGTPVEPCCCQNPSQGSSSWRATGSSARRDNPAAADTLMRLLPYPSTPKHPTPPPAAPPPPPPALAGTERVGKARQWQRETDRQTA